MTPEPQNEAESQEQEHQLWLAARRKGIGGSDAAVLFHCSPWRSAFHLYQDKIGAIEDDRDSPAMYWGRKLEPVVRDAYAEILSREVTDGVEMAKHPEHVFMLANTDGTVMPIPSQDGQGVYEGKTTTVFSAANWDSDVPLYYQVQVQHYLAVLGLSWGSVACLIMGQRDPFVWKDVERNDKFIEALQEKEHEFWHGNVLAREAPPVDGSTSTTNALKLLYPHDSGRLILLPAEATTWWEEREKAHREMKAQEKTKDLQTNRLREAIGNASYAMFTDEHGEATGDGTSCKEQQGRIEASVVLGAVATELNGQVGEEARAIVEAAARADRTPFRVLRKSSAKTLAKIKKGQDRADAATED